MGFFDFLSALFFSQITVGLRGIKHTTKRAIFLQRGWAACTLAKLYLYHPERLTNRWQVAYKEGFTFWVVETWVKFMSPRATYVNDGKRNHPCLLYNMLNQSLESAVLRVI